MINPTLANVIGHNLGLGAEIFQEVAVKLHSIYQKQTWKGYIHHKLLEIRDFIEHNH